jgi:amidohydrolase
VQETARRVLPQANHDNTPYLTMGAEDMAYIQKKVDGCYFFIGSNNKEKHLDYGHHHPKFDFDEQALINGAALMASAAADILK